jgi:S1-C subfamily serine protease
MAMSKSIQVLLFIFVFSMVIVAQSGNSLFANETFKIAKQMGKSFVQVRYYLKYQKGASPSMKGYLCPNCNRYHGTDASKYIKEDRPVVVPGYVVKSNTVVSANIFISPEYIKKITIKFGGTEQTANIEAYAIRQPAVFIKTEQNIHGATPLTFRTQQEGPYLNIAHAFDNGLRQINISPVSDNLVWLPEVGTSFKKVLPSSLIIDNKGRPVALSISNEIDANEDWRQSPLEWETMTTEEMENHLATIKAGIDSSIMRVQLDFRAPMMSVNERISRGRTSSRGIDTQLICRGIIIEKSKLLITTDLKGTDTARLKNIRCYFSDGRTHDARFVASMTDFGIMVAELDSPVENSGIAFTETPILQNRHKLLLGARIKAIGNEFSINFQNAWILEYDVKSKGNLHPEIGANDEDLFLFDTDGNLVAFPISYRRNPSMRSTYSSFSRDIITPVMYIERNLKNLRDYSDPTNAPISQSEERLAWIGVELQRLTQELAREGNVLNLTDKGEAGAIVTHVYRNSPAENAGIKPGFILLRLNENNNQQPVQINLDYDSLGSNFQWERLGEVPEQYFHRIPSPWPSRVNAFTRTLTDFGFGSHILAEFFHDGKSDVIEFIVEPAPKHHEISGSSVNQSIGLTVRDMTYEVRRYFKKDDNDAGVIISSIEPGSKSSVAGLKPYEIITHIDGVEIMTATQFEDNLNKRGQIKLSVQRLAESRIVQLNL